MVLLCRVKDAESRSVGGVDVGVLPYVPRIGDYWRGSIAGRVVDVELSVVGVAPTDTLEVEIFVRRCGRASWIAAI